MSAERMYSVVDDSGRVKASTPDLQLALWWAEAARREGDVRWVLRDDNELMDDLEGER